MFYNAKDLIMNLGHKINYNINILNNNGLSRMMTLHCHNNI